MEPVLTVALPVFAIIAAGYLSGRGGLFGSAASQVLNDFVYYITFPAMIFLSMAEAPVAAVNAALEAAAGGIGFAIERVNLEALGLCPACSEAAA